MNTTAYLAGLHTPTPEQGLEGDAKPPRLILEMAGAGGSSSHGVLRVSVAVSELVHLAIHVKETHVQDCWNWLWGSRGKAARLAPCSRSNDSNVPNHSPVFPEPPKRTKTLASGLPSRNPTIPTSHPCTQLKP